MSYEEYEEMMNEMFNELGKELFEQHQKWVKRIHTLQQITQVCHSELLGTFEISPN